MKNTIAYSVLKYSHSKVLGEEINIGLLFFDYKSQTIEFLYPNSLSRLKAVYPDISLDLVKSYLVAFKKQAKAFSLQSSSIYENIDAFIQEHFLVLDDSSLQFTKASFVFSDIDENLSQQLYYELFLGYYNFPKKHNSVSRKPSEIITRCKKLVSDLSPDIEKHINHSPKEFIYKKVQLTTDLQWQNGTSNFVKGISFDQNNEFKITEKALLIQNKFNYLSDEIASRTAKIDLLLIKPQNEKLFESYQYALEILRANKANIEIIEEADLAQYVQKIIDTIEKI